VIRHVVKAPDKGELEDLVQRISGSAYVVGAQVAVVHEGVRGGAVLTIRGHHLCAAADLAPSLGTGAEDHITHFRRIQVIALGDGLEYRRAKVLRVLFRQGAFALLTDAAGGCDRRR
jgi:hypothetical protein